MAKSFEIFKCKIVSCKAPNAYIVKPDPPPAGLELYRQELNKLASSVKTTTKPLNEDECVAIYNKSLKTWVRGSVLKSSTHNGLLKHNVYTLESGNFSWETDVRVIPKKFFHKLKFAAVHVILTGIRPVIRNETNAWSPEAEQFARSVTHQKAEVHVFERQENVVVFGDIVIIPSNGDPWSLSQMLTKRMWATLECSPEDSLEKSDDSDDGSFKSALSDIEDNDIIDPEKESPVKEVVQNFFADYNQKVCTCRLENKQSLQNVLSESKENMCDFCLQKGQSVKDVEEEILSQHKSEGSAAGSLSSAGKSSSNRLNLFKSRNKVREDIKDSDKTLVPPPINKFANFGEEPRRGLLETQLSTIVVRSNIENLEPCNKIDEVELISPVRAALRNVNITNLRPVQRYSFEAIRKGHNTVLVSERRTGKTFGYVLPIMNELAKFAEENANKDLGHGPLAIIVCTNSSTCLAIESMCQAYANFGSRHGAKNTRIVATYGGGAEKEKHVTLLTGCELLISTVHCLERMLRLQHVTNLDRLKWIAFDQFDQLSSENFVEPFRSIHKRCESVKKLHSIQYIVAAEKLTGRLWQMMNRLEKYTLVMGSHAEAAIYAHLRPEMFLTPKEKKLSKAVDEIIMAEHGRRRIVVACRMKEEVTELYDALKTKVVDLLAIHTGLSYLDAQPIMQQWRNREYPVLVCDDSSIDSDVVPVNDATFLLHYSVPVKSKVMFGLRFSTLMNNYRNHFQDSAEDSPKVKVVILLDEETQKQFRTLVDFVERCGRPVKNNIVKQCEEIELCLEKSKLDKPLCQTLLTRGECSNKRLCEYRHLFLTNDQKGIPRSGELTFTINTVNNTTCWGVRPISIIDYDGKREMIPSQLEELKEKLDRFFADEENWRSIGQSSSVGDLCAIQDRSGVFYRGRIELILKWDKFKKPSKVKIFTIDNGDLLDEYEVAKLFELPQELAAYPPQAVLLYIQGVLPVDFDTDWSPAAFERAVIARGRDLGEDEEWKAKIRLDLTDILIVEGPIVVRHLISAGVTLKEFDFVGDLTGVDDLKKVLAVKNASHIAMLEELCATCGITLSQTSSEKKEVFVHQWAHFQDELSPVVFTYSSGIHKVFLRQRKFDPVLKQLEEECRKHGDLEIERKETLRLNVGAMYLARDSVDEGWMRAIIEEIHDVWAIVLFVDYGNSCNVRVDDIIPIPQNLVTRLPCQAIECRLGGLENIGDRSDVIDMLYDLCDEGDEQCLAHAVRTDGVPSVTDGRLYCVNLLNSQGQSINRLLAQAFNLFTVEAESQLLEDMEIVNGGDSSGFDEDYDLAHSPDVEIADDVLPSVSDEPVMALSDEAIKEFAALSVDELLAFVQATPEVVEDVHEIMAEREIYEKDMDLIKGDESVPDANDKPVESEVFTSADLPLQVQPRKSNEASYDWSDGMLVGPEGARVPLVHWQQCHDLLLFRVKILRVDENTCEVYCSSSTLALECYDEEGNWYSLCWRLFSTVYPGSYEMSITPFEVRIHLVKMVPQYWPRVKLDSERDRKIKYDHDPYLGQEIIGPPIVNQDYIPIAPESLYSDDVSLDDVDF